MVLYGFWWIRYFRSEQKLSDFYSSFLFIPFAGATLPVIAFFMLGIYGRVIWMLMAVIILGIGHIGIHMQHKKEPGAKTKGWLSTPPAWVLTEFTVTVYLPESRPACCPQSDALQSEMLRSHILRAWSAAGRYPISCIRVHGAVRRIHHEKEKQNHT